MAEGTAEGGRYGLSLSPVTMEATCGEDTVQKFFKKEEWESLAAIERNQYCNVFKKYKMMLKLGLSSKPPDFLQRHHDRLRQPRKTEQQSRMVEGKAIGTTTSSKTLTLKELASKHKLDQKDDRDLKSKNMRLDAEKRMLKETSSETISGKVKGPASTVASKSELDFCSANLRTETDGIYCQVRKEVKKNGSSLKVKRIQSKMHSVTHSMNTSYKCYVCGDMIYKKNEFVSHLRDHIGEKCFKCDECGYTFRELRYLRKHLSRTSVGQFQCSYCSHTFIHKQSCTIHERIHDQRRGVPCCLCDMNFPDVKHLRNHVLKVHSKKEFECFVCGMSFSTHQTLKKHISRVSMDLPYCCSVCGHRYSSKIGLSRHEYQHGKIRSLQCKFCLKMFGQKTHLTHHLASRRRLKKYECLGCKSKFKTSTSLRIHIQIYSADRPFRCSECGHTFTSQGRLVSHIKLHTGERWKCHSCGDTFKKKVFLKTHLQIHSRQFSGVVKTQDRNQDQVQSSCQTRLPDFAWPPESRNLSCVEKLKNFRYESPRMWSSLWSTEAHKQSFMTQHSQKYYLHQQTGYRTKKMTDILRDADKCKTYGYNLCSQSVQESRHYPQDMNPFHHSHQNNSEVEPDVSVDVTGFDDAQHDVEEPDVSVDVTGFDDAQHDVEEPDVSVDVTGFDDAQLDVEEPDVSVDVTGFDDAQLDVEEPDVSVDVTGFDDAQLDNSPIYSFQDQQKLTVQKVCNSPSVCSGDCELFTYDSPVSRESFPCTKCKSNDMQEKTVRSGSQHHQGQVTKIKKHTRFQCLICHKWISTLFNLQRHILVHSAIKSFACPLCKNIYRRSDTMKLHFMRVHGLHLKSKF